MLQGVREVFEMVDLEEASGGKGGGGEMMGKVGKGKMVLIGRGLDFGEFQWSLLWSLARGRSEEQRRGGEGEEGVGNDG